jgi:hypothetical protein
MTLDSYTFPFKEIIEKPSIDDVINAVLQMIFAFISSLFSPFLIIARYSVWDEVEALIAYTTLLILAVFLTWDFRKFFGDRRLQAMAGVGYIILIGVLARSLKDVYYTFDSFQDTSFWDPFFLSYVGYIVTTIIILYIMPRLIKRGKKKLEDGISRTSTRQ